LVGIKNNGGCLQDGGIKGAVIPAPPYSSFWANFILLGGYL